MEDKLKRFFGLVLTVILSMAATSVMAQRKLPAKAYLTSAKIDVIEDRPQEAIALLDSLFMNYGPVSEGLALMGQIMVDLVSAASTAQAKAPHVEKMVAYFDSLRMCCSNEKIDSKFRKDCDKLVGVADSTEVQFWREFYNSGLEHLTSLQEFSGELSSAQDSETVAYYTKAIDGKADTCMAYMSLALKIDSNDYRPLVAIGSILDGQKKYADAIPWFQKGLAHTEDSSSLLLSLAYDFINLNQYCEAIPYFEHYFRLNPSDLPNANNLTICYIRCEKDKEAVATYRKMLEADSNHSGALLGIANFYRRDAGELVKKAKSLNEQKKEAESRATRERANLMFDTAVQYYERHIKAYPDSLAGYDESGLINFILGKYDKAALAFKKLTELQPDKVDSWISLGDSYFSLNDFNNAITGYEKAVALNPDKKILWERLSFLYLETGQTGKKANADQEIRRLQN